MPILMGHTLPLIESKGGCVKYEADHHISKDQHVWAFSESMKPVLRVKSGAKIHLETN